MTFRKASPHKPESVCSDGVILISFTSESFHDTFCSVLGTHVAQHGQARCPKWADFISCLCPKVYHESGIRWGVCVYDRLLLSLILSLRGGVVSMVCGRDTNQKKNETRIGYFTVPFFDYISLMILGFWFWI